jgi:hypothetical protein
VGRYRRCVWTCTSLGRPHDNCIKTNIKTWDKRDKSWRQHHDWDRCAAVFIISFVSAMLLSLRHVADIVSWLLHVLTHANVRPTLHRQMISEPCANHSAVQTEERRGSSCQLVPYIFRLLAQSSLLANKSQINATQITEIPEILPVVTHSLHLRKSSHSRIEVSFRRTEQTSNANRWSAAQGVWGILLRSITDLIQWMIS